MAGHFTHYAVTDYASICATCTLSASATVQVAHILAHPLNSYDYIMSILAYTGNEKYIRVIEQIGQQYENLDIDEALSELNARIKE